MPEEEKKDKRDWLVIKVTLSPDAKRRGLRVIYPYYVDVIIEGGERCYWLVPSITSEYTRYNLDLTLIAH